MATAVPKLNLSSAKWVAKAAAVVVALALVFSTLASSAVAANAALPAGVTPSIQLNGTESYGELPVLKKGDKVTMQFQYGSDVVPGSSFTVKVSDNVTLPASFPTNEAIASVVPNAAGELTITFKDPWPADVDQGMFAFDVTVNDVTSSGKDQITWEIDGEEGSVDVIIRKEGDQFANVTDAASKTVALDALQGYIKLGDNCAVTLDPAVMNHDITYTLYLDSKDARTGYSIADKLPASLSYVPASFASTLTTWDTDGLNKSTAPFAFAPTISGQSFTSTVNVPANSKLEIKYKVKISDVAAIEAALVEKCVAMNGAPGRFTVALTNEATFGADHADNKRTATFNFHGTIAGVDTGKAFDKRADWTHTTVETAADGKLTPAQQITFTLAADLTGWTGAGANFTLNRNVVIIDDLPTQGTWDTGAADFITATGITLTEATSCPTEADFKADEFVGKYCVDGQKLLVNIGKNNTTKASIQAKALITTVKGLEAANGETSVVGGLGYKFRNTASFQHHDSRSEQKGWNSFPIVLPESNEGHNDPSAFTKKGKISATSVLPGETVTAEYNIAVTAGKGIDMTKSTIVDYVDTSLFDLGDIATLPVTGAYDGQRLDRSHFVITQDADGYLVITLSDAGKAIVTAQGIDKHFSVALTLTTFPFDGKETKTIKNKASIFGADGKPIYWSEASGEATSFGDEAEVRKRLLDPASGEWVPTLDAQLDVNGNLVRDVYSYRVEFIPHGSYNNVVISDINDVLPASVDFLGFVEPEDALDVQNPTAGPVALKGNIEAVFESGVVKLKQIDGTKLKAGEPIAAYFAVKINDFTAPIVNKIGSTEATIVPKDPPSIDIEKWNAEPSAEAPEYDATGKLLNDGFAGDFDAAPGKTLTAGKKLPINFTVSNDGGEALKDIEVTDSLTNGEGVIADLSCEFPDGSTGVTWTGPFAPATQFSCTGTLPALNAGQTHSNIAKVTGIGVTSGDTVDDNDEWHGNVPDEEGVGSADGGPEGGSTSNADADGVGAANGGPGADAQGNPDAAANAAAPKKDGLAETGGSSMIPLIGGALALGLGGLVLMLAMRRRYA